MNPNGEYNDYSAVDAPEHLIYVLHQFFEQKQNSYKFALAKKHFDDVTNQEKRVDATRLFKILTGTNLVTKKHVLHYRTAQGMRYLVKREYAQSYERNIRTARRSHTKNKNDSDPQNETTPSPFIQLMSSKTPLDDSSSDESNDTTPTESKRLRETSPAVSETKENDNDNVETHDNVETSSSHSDIAKHAEALEKTMETAMADLDDPEPTLQTEHEFADTLENLIMQHISPILTRLDNTENLLHSRNEQYETLVRENNEMNNKITFLQQEYDRLNRQVNFNSRTIQVLENRVSLVQTANKKIDDKIEGQIHKKLDDHLQNFQNKNKSSLNDDESVQSIITTQQKVQRRLSRLKDGTKTMFKDIESDYDLLTDRIHRLESDVKKLQTNKRKSTQRKLDYSHKSESDTSSFSSVQPQQTHSKYNHSNTPSNIQYRNTYYRGPNIDYLRKNVNITCSAQNQILEFYIKFRLAVEQGGIHILPIDQITKHKSIAQDKPGITEEDKRLQSNALFTLLSNENIIPSDFTMAQNCILGFASTMDGFGALRAMLKLTHPTLSKKRPSNVPPVLSDSSDIHAYEQNLRNFYLLHKLFNDIEFPPIEKAKQFLQGMDDGQYAEAVQRVQHQLDTFESLKVPLTEDYDIDNIASTIINISTEYDNTKTVVNTMKNYPQSPGYQRKNPQYPKQFSNVNKPQKSMKYRSEKFDKAQCYACKLFGHTVTHCRILPKVLAILQFKDKHNDKCDTILRQHIRNNTIESKRVFVRTLQNMNILSESENPDSYLETDMIVHTMIDNGIDDNDLQNTDE